MTDRKAGFGGGVSSAGGGLEGALGAGTAVWALQNRRPWSRKDGFRELFFEWISDLRHECRCWGSW